MKNFIRKMTVLISALLVICLLSSSLCVFADTNHNTNNRFNVMIVLDASGSMNNTDPNNLRYDAISIFVNMLAERGNYLGGIVFESGVKSMEPILINSQADKDKVTDFLSSVKPTIGYTNLGEALTQAVALLDKGDPSLPSVIVLLSDGNTAMPTDAETKQSVAKIDPATTAAYEKGIPVYSVCLNVTKDALTKEMSDISERTGGVFQEVSSAEDLRGVFTSFYNLIYGAFTKIVDVKFDEEGVVEVPFEVPGIGVEEINIVIYGTTKTLDIYDPMGNKKDYSSTELNSLTILKFTDVVPGKWNLVATGIPGDQIKINMVYNSDLSVDARAEKDTVDTGSPVTITATLSTGNKAATSSDQYEGYKAHLIVMDAFENAIGSPVEMTVSGDSFRSSRVMDNGIYKFKVIITGDYILEKESAVIGPITVSEPVSETKNEPLPPTPVENPVEYTVNIWPFKEASLEIDMKTLATDPQNDEIRYKVVSSSFREGEEYSVTGDEIIKVTHFGLTKGAFTVKATNAHGLSCDIEINVISHNIGLMALIGIGGGGLIALIIIAVGLYIALNKRFMGVCYVTKFDEEGNYYEEEQREKSRGRIPLSSFRVTLNGLDASKCYFQATDKDYVYFCTNKKCYGNGMLEKKFQVSGDGFETTISTDEFSANGIKIRFVSRKNNTDYSF